MMLAAGTTAPDALTAVETVGAVIAGGVGTVLLLLPGWTVMRVYQGGRRQPQLSDRELVALTAFWGVIVQLLILAWTVPLTLSVARDGPLKHVWDIVAWTVGAIYGIPIVLGLVARTVTFMIDRVQAGWLNWFLRRLDLTRGQQAADGWTYMFAGLEKGAYLRVRLRDGKVVLGEFGRTSLAGDTWASRDLFLQKRWTADAKGGFKARAKNCNGVWLNAADIELIEVY